MDTQDALFMPGKSCFRLLSSVAIGVGWLLLLIVLLHAQAGVRVGAAPPAQGVHSPGELYVRAGASGSVCTRDAPCGRVQQALDIAGPGDHIYVAGGVYTDPAGTVAVITKTVTLQGGWSADFTARDTLSYPTTLDAQELGSVMRIISATGQAVSPTVDGFVITHGDASDDGGCGGGVYIEGAGALLINNVISGNVAHSSGAGYGGGIYVRDSLASVVISGSIVQGNIASTGRGGYGGGVYLEESLALVSGSVIQSNTSSIADVGIGGGILLREGTGTLTGNLVQYNVGSSVSDGDGGGLYSVGSTVVLRDNTVRDNVASVPAVGHGGGLYSWTDLALTAERNTFLSNTATLSPTASGLGGGCAIYVARQVGSFTMTNNLVARNRAGEYGDGVFIWSFGMEPPYGSLINNTIADNASDEESEGVFIANSGIFTMVNNIIAGHGLGITCTQTALVTGSHNLFWDNASDPITATGAILGDPCFVDADAGDYHLGAGSAAIDQGTSNSAPPTDLDGDLRPAGDGVDIGADEFVASAETLWDVYIPLLLRNYPP